jgi:predicted P-loop ATPase
MTFIECDGPIDLAWAENNRDLLFGEAVERYNKEETWWFDEDDMIRQQKETNAQFVKLPRGYDIVSLYLSTRTKVSAAEIGKLLSTTIRLSDNGTLIVNPSKIDRRDEMDAAATATLLGWQQKRIWVGKRYLQHYLSPDYRKDNDGEQKEKDKQAVDDATGAEAATPEEFITDHANQWDKTTEQFLKEQFEMENQQLIKKLKDTF